MDEPLPKNVALAFAEWSKRVERMSSIRYGIENKTFREYYSERDHQMVNIEEWFMDWSVDQETAKSFDYEERWNEV